MPLPSVAGNEAQAVFYLANRLDEEISFTREACEQLADIPQAFLKDALKSIIVRARETGAREVDPELLDRIRAERSN